MVFIWGCSTSDNIVSRQSDSIIRTDIELLQHYYPDSLQLTLINDLNKITGSYSLNAGLNMRFIEIDSTYYFQLQEWTDSLGKGKKRKGRWEIKHATIFIAHENYQEAFDVVGYQDKILLIPVKDRTDFVSLLNTLSELKKDFSKQYAGNELEEKINEGLLLFLSRHQIFTKDK